MRRPGTRIAKLGTRLGTMAGGVLVAGMLSSATPARAQILTLDLLNDLLLDLDVQVTLNTGNIATNTAAITTLNNAIAGQAATITSLAGDVAAVGQAAADLDIRADALELGVAANAGAIATLAGTVAQQGGAIVANGDAIVDLDVRTGALEVAVTAQGDAIVDLDARVDQQGADIAGHTILLGEHQTRLDTQAGQLLALDTRVTGNSVAIAATAGQLATLTTAVANGTIGLVQQQGPGAPITVGAATGGGLVSFAGTDGDRRLTNVAPGIAPNDAATVGQVAASADRTLSQANAYTDAAVARQQRDLRRDLDALGASTAAIAGLPQSIIPGEGMIGASVGGHGGEFAFALGLSKAFDAEHMPVIKAGAAVDTRRGEVTYNAAIGFHF